MRTRDVEYPRQADPRRGRSALAGRASGDLALCRLRGTRLVEVA